MKQLKALFIYKHKILLILFTLFIIFYFFKNNIEYIYIDIEKYIKFNLAGNLYHSTSEFYKRENPEISIVISTFNGKVFLKPAVRSIQNQNFLNLEIIIVDDGSMDNTVELAKELMKEDRRIKLISNIINRGTLYTKTNGVLNAKGKYVMTLDHDNLYSTKYVFSRLYQEAKKYNLDLLGFSAIVTRTEIKNMTKSNFANYFETAVIKKPDIQKRFLGKDISNQTRFFLCLFFIKTELFLKIINQLGYEFINRNIDTGDDTILVFILSRKALTLKHLKEIFYIILEWPKKYSKLLIFQKYIKHRERERKKCYSLLTFTEILLKFTENNEKYIAEYYFLSMIIRHKKCNNQTDILKDYIRVSNLYLNNEYVSTNTKRIISKYLNKIKNI